MRSRDVELGPVYTGEPTVDALRGSRGGARGAASRSRRSPATGARSARRSPVAPPCSLGRHATPAVPSRRPHRDRRRSRPATTTSACSRARSSRIRCRRARSSPLDDVHLLAPVLPSKLVCVGKNYAAHAAEFGMTVPEEPLLFLKPSTAVIGPDDPIHAAADQPAHRLRGRARGRDRPPRARTSAPRTPTAYILGYTCANDVTLRDLQKTDDQWARAKGFDGSCPLGPWIETDLDPNDVVVETRLNGEVRQHAQHRRHGLRRRDPDRVHHGVHDAPARRRDPDRARPRASASSRAGDVVEVEVEGVGTLANPVR